MSPRYLTLAALTLLLGICSPVLSAQGAPRRVEPEVERLVEVIADSARALGLPADALRAKAAEGRFKGATDGRIVAAVRTFFHELREAQRALGERSSSGELIAGATALRAGVPSDRLRQLRNATGARRTDDLAVPIVVLVDLVTRRVPADAAANAIEQLLQHRAGDADFKALRATVEQDILSGQSPVEAAAARTRAMRERLGGRLEVDRRADPRLP